LPSLPEKQRNSESQQGSTASGKTDKGRISRRDIQNGDLDVLVPANQKGIVDQLIADIQRGEIEAKVLVPNSRSDLQISAIEIPPIATALAGGAPSEPSSISGMPGGTIAGH
jgi:hypothetical protein